MAMTFWARVAMRIAKCTKLLSHFKDAASLLKSLPGWRATSSKPKEHMLYAFLQLIATLERYNQASQGDAASSVMTKILEPLRKQATELFSPKTLGSTSSAELLQLQMQSATLDIIERELFNQRLYRLSWQSDIREHLHRRASELRDRTAHDGADVVPSFGRWQKAFNFVQAELPFLEALQRDGSGVPQLVTQLESEALFRATEQEAKRESSTAIYGGAGQGRPRLAAATRHRLEAGSRA